MFNWTTPFLSFIRKDGHKDRQTHRQVDTWTDRWIDRLRQTDGKRWTESLFDITKVFFSN